MPAQPAHNSSQHGNISDTLSNLQPSFDGFILARDPNHSGQTPGNGGPVFRDQGGIAPITNTGLVQASNGDDINSNRNNQASFAPGEGPTSSGVTLELYI